MVEFVSNEMAMCSDMAVVTGLGMLGFGFAIGLVAGLSLRKLDK